MKSQRRLGFIPGGSAQFNRYKVLKRQQRRVNHLNHNNNDNDDNSSNSDHSLETDPDLEIQKVVDHVQTFAHDLYLALREKHQTNLVYSPLGFCISTVLIKLSSVGIGKEELIRAFFVNPAGDGDYEDVDEAMVVGLSALLDCLQGGRYSFIFKHAHRIFIDLNHKPRKSLKNLLKTIIPSGGVGVEEMDFSNMDWEESSTRINRWAHESGGKMLGEMLTRRSPGKQKMIFCNPVYFMGNWVHPFNPKWTKEERFFLNERQSVYVPTMKSGILKTLLFSPLNKLGCRAIVLPYKGDRLGLVIFLPNEKCGLTLIESNLDSISPASYLEEMQNYRKKLSSKSGYRVFLPKLRFDSTIDYQGPMKEMGIETIFLPGKADFSGLAHISGKDLNISEIFQKVVFEINEMGTEAIPKRFKSQNAESENKEAGIVANVGQDGYSEIIDFRVNHPFYFQLIDMKTDLILLAGACRNPLHGNDLGFKEFLEKYDIQVNSKLPQAVGEVKTWKLKK